MKAHDRTHRKIMVVDGRIGYTGGAGIADEWSGNAQAAFMENWIEVTGNVLHGAQYFPELGRAGSHAAQFVVTSSPRRRNRSSSPRRTSCPTTSRSARWSRPPGAACACRSWSRGRKPTRRRCAAPRARPGEELLRAGVEFYEYQPTFFHCKVMIVDELWVSVGSTNFDARSFSVNDEANLKRISLEEWEKRPWTEKLWEHTMGLFSSQL